MRVLSHANCFASRKSPATWSSAVWTESRTVLEAVEHYDSAVFVGGAMVVDTKKEVVLHRMMMQPDLARELCRHLEDAGHAVLALQDTHAAPRSITVTRKPLAFSSRRARGSPTRPPPKMVASRTRLT